jgi:hypothetical protein
MEGDEHEQDDVRHLTILLGGYVQTGYPMACARRARSGSGVDPVGTIDGGQQLLTFARRPTSLTATVVRARADTRQSTQLPVR